MNGYESLYSYLKQGGAAEWAMLLPGQLQAAFSDSKHGDLQRWSGIVNSLPALRPSSRDLQNRVRIGSEADLPEAGRELLRRQLLKLHPWRKGPYDVFGVEVDSEWRSDWKWDRLKDHIQPLRNRLVLDVGCGNGYHCWRMLGAGARLVIGVDPTLLSVMQFQAIAKLHGDAAIHVLPLGIEDLPRDMKLFDTVFSMGVLYHRRSPIDHLLELKGLLRPSGELVLETLVIEGEEDNVLVPRRRYAQMRNIWFLPSCAALHLWLERCGFRNIRLLNVTKTTVEEQRGTEWMHFQSLRDFLDPNDENLTCEGLPAPRRAIFLASND